MTDKKRRQFVTFMGASTVAIPVSALVGSRAAFAADEPMVDETSAAAINWDYKTTSAMPDQMCGNCALYQGEADAKGGPCPLFPGSHVDTAGWCKAYSPKPG